MKPMSRRRKFTIGVILFCILLLFSFLPVRTALANRYLEAYAAAKYPSAQLSRKAAYNLVNSSYDTEISIDGASYRLSYDFSSRSIYDLYQNEKLSSQVKADFQKILPSFPGHLSFLGGIGLFAGVNPQNYARYKQRLYLTGVYNSESITEEESLQMPAQITLQVMEQLGERYNITAVQIIYYDQNGGYTAEIGIKDTYAPVTYEQLIGHTRKLGSKELGEHYKNWLAGQ